MRLLVSALLCLLSGCGAGAAGIAIGLIELSSNRGGTPVIDLPPVITEVRVGPAPSPDRVLVEFKITNEDAGRLGARIEWVNFERGAGGDLHRSGPAVRATPAPGSHPLTDLLPRTTVRFFWDAKKDLADAS